MDVSAASNSLNAHVLAAQKTNVQDDTQAKQTAAQTAALVASGNPAAQSEDGFASTVLSSSETGTTYNRATASKGLSKQELQDLTTQQLAAYSQMIDAMAGNQVLALKTASGSTLADTILGTDSGSSTPLKDVVAGLKVSQQDIQAAQNAVSEGGEWGVDAVAGRIVDMAVALSGGDSSKFETLRNAAITGFNNAAAQWGVDDISQMPSITSDTYNEVMKRFDYLESNGSMVGYVYGQTTVSEDNN